MHKIYEDKGIFDFLFQIPQILYSSIISSVLNIILKNLSLSQKKILELKSEISEKHLDFTNSQTKSNQIKKSLKIKLIIFFILSSLLMIFFWYFISCFCGVYINTQTILFKDTFMSFGSSLVFPFILSLIPGCFRIPSLRAKKKNLKLLYKLSLLINLLL